MELLLFSLPRLPSFGGSDPPSLDSLPAPIMRASRRLSFRSVLESLFPITGGKFSIGMPESSIISTAEAEAVAFRPGSLRSDASQHGAMASLLLSWGGALADRMGLAPPIAASCSSALFRGCCDVSCRPGGSLSTYRSLYLPLRLRTVRSKRDTPRANCGRWSRIRWRAERQV